MINLKSITKQKNGRYRLEFDIDDVISKHTVLEETLLSLSLFSPRPLTKDEYENTIQKGEYDLLYQKCLDFINFQMRTVYEINKYLKKYTSDLIIMKKIVTKLKLSGFLNDNDYMKRYISEKMEYDYIGPAKIKESLFKKGLNKEFIDDNLKIFSADLQVEKIIYLIEKETRYPIKKPYLKFVNSFKQKLINKGFSLSSVNAAIDIKKDIIIESIDIEELIRKEIALLKRKYDISIYEEKDIIVKKLLQKGFIYSNINKYLKGAE